MNFNSLFWNLIVDMMKTAGTAPFRAIQGASMELFKGVKSA
jgi:hypothetical protein